MEVLQYRQQGPWYDGRRAYHAHKTIEDSPYPPDTQDTALWRDGWAEESFYGGWECRGLWDKVADESQVVIVDPLQILEHATVVDIPKNQGGTQ